MSTCRWAPRSRASRIRSRSRPAASRFPTSGASGRSSGVSADTFTLRLTRAIAAARVALEIRPLGPARGRLVRACGAPRGSARRNGRPPPSVTVASPSRSTEAATPSFHRPCSSRRASCGVSPTMKRWAMCRTPAAAASPSARAPPSSRPSASPRRAAAAARRPRRRNALRWRARSSSERQAGTTSTKRNSAARSSASRDARSIALSSSALSGWRIADGNESASSRPTRWISCSSDPVAAMAGRYSAASPCQPAITAATTFAPPGVRQCVAANVQRRRNDAGRSWRGGAVAALGRVPRARCGRSEAPVRGRGARARGAGRGGRQPAAHATPATGSSPTGSSRRWTASGASRRTRTRTTRASTRAR